MKVKSSCELDVRSRFFCRSAIDRIHDLHLVDLALIGLLALFAQKVFANGVVDVGELHRFGLPSR